MDKIYKEASRKSGVYTLTNKIDGKFYIGSCREFKERWQGHERSLLGRRHRNQHLQRAFDLYGSNAFVFEIVEIIEGDKQLRLVAEQKLLDLYWDGCKQCYNISKWAQAPKGGFISHTPEETRIKIGQAQKGKIVSQETREKLSIAKKGKHPSPETEFKEGHVPWSKNKTDVYSEEVVRKMSENMKIFWKDATNKEIRLKHMEHNFFQFGEKHKRAKIITGIKLLSPDGIEFNEIKCLTEFCRVHGLHQGNFYQLVHGKRTACQGWKLIN